MKKLIVIILVLISGLAKAQTPPRTGYLVQPAKWKFVNPIWLDSGAYITKISKTSGQNRYLVYDSVKGTIGYRFVSTDLSGYVPYTGATTNVNIGANTYIGHSLKSDASDGVLLEAANGTDVGIFGAGNTANSSLYGGLTIGSLTSGNGTDSVVVASSAGLLKKRPASAFGSTYTGGNGIIVGGSTIYGDTTKLASRRTPVFLTNITTPLIVGGTTTTSPLTFKTTSGVGTTGADMHFLVGNNGGTEAMTILNNGDVGINDAAPSQKFVVRTGIGIAVAFGSPSSAPNDPTIMTTRTDNSFGRIFQRQRSTNDVYIGDIDASSGKIFFRTDGNNVLAADESGNIGIGGTGAETTPKVYVYGSGNVTIGATTSISRFAIPIAPTASANYGLVSLGNGAFDGTTTGKYVGSSSGQYIAVNSVGSVAYNYIDLQKNGSSRHRIDSTGKTTYASTITAGGTTGNQTINKPSGTVNIAAAGTTVTVTNSLVSTSSIVVAVVRTNDTTAYIKNVVPSAGSFIINLGAATTAEVSIGFIVYN